MIVGNIELDEDGLIDNLLQNQPLAAMPIDEIVDESLGKHKNNPWDEFFISGSDQDHAKIFEIYPSKTLKLNPSLSTEKEEKLLTMLRQHLNAFSWEYKDMKGTHPSVCTHHVYIK